jgi:hypothetical protein
MNLIFSTINHTKYPSIIYNNTKPSEKYININNNSIINKSPILTTASRTSYNMFAAIQNTSNCNCGK